MRKLIIMALSVGLFLMADFAAYAETKINLSGFYKIFHENNVNFLRNVDSDHRDNESYFWHRLQLTVDFKPTEDVTVRWVLRGPNNVRWGQVPYGDASGANLAARPLDLFTRAIYATVNTDYGKFVLGRHNGSMVGNIGGLETLGYNQRYGDFLVVHAFDWNLPFDGITYSKTWDNGFGIHVLYVKERSENSTAHLYDSDNDADRFGIEPFYKWDGGGVSLLLSYARDKSPNNSYNLTQGGVTYAYPVRDNWTFFVNPALILSWGNFTFHFEGKAAVGETEYRRSINQAGAPVLRSTKIKDAGLGFYLDGVYKYGPGAVTLAAWFVDGSSPDEGGG
ncbi:MAG: porin, partial [Deltaproteobacteria bacterium]|nr:porin [Deltaproteobacteria bacterium]